MHGWDLKAVIHVHGSLTQLDVDCFCSSSLLVSTHTLHFGTVPVDGILGLVGINCYAILTPHPPPPPQLLLTGYALFPQCRMDGIPCREPHRPPGKQRLDAVLSSCALVSC